MSLGLSAAAWGAIGSTAISAYSASRSSRAGGGGGGGGGGLDPFGQYRGQFGNQLSQLFGPKLDADGNPIKNADGTTQYNTPSWLTPGAGMNFGQDLHPGQGLPGMSDIPGAGTGMASNDMLKFDPAAIANDPAYQFQRRQGMEALDSGAAAAGELNSGGARAAAVQYGQGIASDFTNQQLQRNLARYQAQNQAQNQGFGQSMGRFGAQMGLQGQNFSQVLASMGFQNQAQGQQFNQGNQYASLLAMLGGANLNPADASRANTYANANAYGQNQQNWGNVLNGLGGVSRAWGAGSGGGNGITYPSGGGVQFGMGAGG